jgi:hypothetical protein
MSRYWLSYRRDGGLVGAAVFEAQLPIEAKLKAAMAGLPDGFDCTCELLAQSTRRKIPKSMMSRLLGPAELAQLHVKLWAKKPAAKSVRRRELRKRSAAN